MENLTLSGVSVSDAAVAQLAKCVSSGASYPMQDLRRTFRQHLTGPGQRYFTGIQERLVEVKVEVCGVTMSHLSANVSHLLGNYWSL